MADIVDLPGKIMETLRADQEELTLNEPKDWDKILGQNNPEGVRNNTAASIAGKLLSGIKSELWSVAGWSGFKDWNINQNKPPLGERELRSVWESISKKHLSEKDENSGKQKVFKFTKLSELLARKYDEPRWIVDKLVQSEGITAISGVPGCYKTFIVLEIAKRIANGEQLFGTYSTTKCGVMIIDEEGGERLLHTRFKLLDTASDANIITMSYQDFKLRTHDINQIVSECKMCNIKLVILDSLVRIHTGNENDAKDMAKVHNLLRIFTKEGITVIITHHNRKPGIFSSNPAQEMRGSSEILAFLDGHLAVKEKDGLLTITQTKVRDARKRKPFQLKIDSDEKTYFKFEYVGEQDEEKSKIDIAKEAVILTLEEEGVLNKTRIVELLEQAKVGCGKSAIKTALSELETDGVVFTKKGKGNMTFCSLKPFEEVEEIT